MDANSALLQIPASISASSSEGAASRSQAGQHPRIGGTRKVFSSVLRTVQQGEDKGRPQQSDDGKSGRVAKSDPKTDRGKPVRDEATRSSEIEGRGSDTKTERRSQSRIDRSEDREDPNRDGGTMQTDIPSEQVRVVDHAVSSQDVLAPPMSLSPDKPDQSSIEDDLVTSSENNETSRSSAMTVLMPSEVGTLVSASDTTVQLSVSPQGATVPLMQQQDQATSIALPMHETSEASPGQVLGPPVGPSIKAVDSEAGEQRETLVQGSQDEKQTASVQPPAEGRRQASPASQELSRRDAGGPELIRPVEQPVQQKQDDAGAHPHRDPHPPLLSSNTAGQERMGKSMDVPPQGLHAGTDSGKAQDFFGSHQEEQQSASGENPWKAQGAMAPSPANLPGEPQTQSMTVGTASSPQPRPVDSRATTPAGSPASVAPTQDIEPFVPTMSRSVVFEVGGADLGRINIRVGIANELVHAHLSSDRSDVGQWLFNGQDRLQSALQSNGLELGQFRVDIDRQNAGRSFQQGSPQDQSRMWQQASNGASREEGFFERHEAGSHSYTGRLNVVA